MTRIIGVTGGIGSGKSTLTRRFSDHGIPAVDADAIARTALTPASACFEDAIALFGSEALLPDGTANRAYIASRVFQDPSLREQLNGIIHPFVLREMLRISEESEAPLAVWDVPLLFESGADAFCACTVAVLCGEDIRVARVAARDHAEESAIRARIKAQLTDEQRAALATYTIRNEDSPEVFYREADELIERIQRELI
jgi:dephospho-CoA kinase